MDSNKLLQYQDSAKNGSAWSNILAVVVVSTSPWLFDPQVLKLLKPIHVDLPSKETRKDLIEFYLRDTLCNYKLAIEELNELSEKTAGYTGSDICCLVKDAGMEQVRQISNAKFFKKVLVPAVNPNTSKSKHKELGGGGGEGPPLPMGRNVETETGPQGDVQQEKGLEGQVCGSTLVEKLTPCLASDEGAFEASLWDLDAEMIHVPEPHVTYAAMLAALSRSKPSVSATDLAKMSEFKTKTQSCG